MQLATLSLATLGAALLGTVSACGDVVTPEPVGDYTSWKRIDTYGELPGHGDSYRIIYANDIALTYAGGTYPEGAIIVKEIRDRAGPDGTEPGDIRYAALMRRIGPARLGLDDEAGWLFTQTRGGLPSDEGAEEIYRSLCWSRCHVAAPYAGAFLDYGK